MSFFERYDKRIIEPFAIKTIAASFDERYGMYHSPIDTDNFDYISKLKDKGYDLYILSDIAKESHEYVKRTFDVDKIFKGGIYSYQEKFLKPDKEIYELIVDRYHLNKNETMANKTIQS